MRKFLQIASLILVFSWCVFAQSLDSLSCPTITLVGPAGIVNPGEIANYTVQVDTKGKQYDLEYIWTVSAGKIVSGQGTTLVGVRMPELESLTVTIEIKGLPNGCPNMSSETQPCRLRSPEAIKLDEFSGPLAKISNERFTKIVDAAKSQPNAQLYVITSGSERNPSLSIKRKRNIIVDRIVAKFGEDPTRVTFVVSDKNDDRVVIWLVPPGADPPMIFDK